MILKNTAQAGALAAAVSMLAISASAQSNSTTEIGIYGFASSLSGNMEIGDLESDIDQSFSDIVETLDFAFMGFVDHRMGKWSFIADLFYIELSDSAGGKVDLDFGLKQTLIGAYAGYSVLDRPSGSAGANVDLLWGFRYNRLDADLEARVVGADGVTRKRSRDGDRNWTDGVLGVRGSYDFGNGWAANGWLDIGVGEDTSSYQAILTGSYAFDNNVKLYGGYRHYHIDLDSGSVNLNADYTGPIVGISYQF